MWVNGASITRYCVLCSNTYSPLHSCHNFPVGSRQVARGACFCETETSLFTSTMMDKYDSCKWKEPPQEILSFKQNHERFLLSYQVQDCSNSSANALGLLHWSYKHKYAMQNKDIHLFHDLHCNMYFHTHTAAMFLLNKVEKVKQKWNCAAEKNTNVFPVQVSWYYATENAMTLSKLQQQKNLISRASYTNVSLMLAAVLNVTRNISKSTLKLILSHQRQMLNLTLEYVVPICNYRWFANFLW